MVIGFEFGFPKVAFLIEWLIFQTRVQRKYASDADVESQSDDRIGIWGAVGLQRIE